MTAYALAHLRTVDVNAEIGDYLLRIDETLEPYEGRFLVHGSTPEVVEGDLPGFVVIVEFPDRERAKAWYESPGYQAILPLRVNNSDSVAAILRGVPDGYSAASFAAKLAG
jgi:uncharacterized protein (DUF1330 family)